MYGIAFKILEIFKIFLIMGFDWLLASGCVVIAAYIDVIDFTVLLLPLLLLLFLFAVVVAAFLLWFACYCCLSLKMTIYYDDSRMC